MVTPGLHQQSCRAASCFNDIRSPSDSPRVGSRLMMRSMGARERVVIAPNPPMATVTRQVHCWLCEYPEPGSPRLPPCARHCHGAGAVLSTISYTLCIEF